MKNPAHKATSGLIDVTLDYEELDNNFKYIIDNFLNNIHALDQEYRYVKIIDTFFSDTLKPHLLNKIFKESKRLNFKVQIVLLNPISESAKERDHNLYANNEFDRIYHLNLGLSYIKNALSNRKSHFRIPDVKLKNPQFLFSQLKELNEFIESAGFDNIEIRLATYKRFPLYIFGQYACSGNFLEFSSARDTPWCFWINDRSQDNDQYDNFIKHFDKHWNGCKLLNNETLSGIYKEMKGTENQIFLSFAKQDLSLREEVISIVEEYDFIVTDYKIESEKGNDDYDLQDKLDRMFNTSIAVIVILTADPELPENINLPRPNILIELGRAQTKHAPLVLLLKDPNLVEISNLNGVIYENLEQGNNSKHVKRSSVINFLKRIKNSNKLS